MAKRIRVFVIDESTPVRQTLIEILESAPDSRVMGSALDQLAAAEVVRFCKD